MKKTIFAIATLLVLAVIIHNWKSRAPLAEATNPVFLADPKWLGTN